MGQGGSAQVEGWLRTAVPALGRDGIDALASVPGAQTSPSQSQKGICAALLQQTEHRGGPDEKSPNPQLFEKALRDQCPRGGSS